MKKTRNLNLDLSLACQSGEAEQVARLLKEGANVNAYDDEAEYKTPLLVACRFGEHKVVELLLKAHANVNQSMGGERGATPLHLACLENHPEVVALLLSHELIDLSLVDGVLGDTPLCTACKKGHDKVVALLLPRLKTKPSIEYQYPLYHACRKGHNEVVRLLIQADAEVNPASTKDSQLTPLYAALANEHLTAARLLIRAGAEMTKNDWVQLYKHWLLFPKMKYDIQKWCNFLLVEGGFWPEKFWALTYAVTELKTARKLRVDSIIKKLTDLCTLKQNKSGLGVELRSPPEMDDIATLTGRIHRRLAKYKLIIDTHMVASSSTNPTASRKKIDALCKQAGIKLGAETTEAEAGAAEAEKPTLCTLS